MGDAESEICDKSRTASELTNKHQTHFWIGMVKEVRGKADTKPKFVDPETWKKKLCAAVHNDVQRMAGIKAAEFLTSRRREHTSGKRAARGPEAPMQYRWLAPTRHAPGSPQRAEITM